jgi:type IV pilus assembly protein PilC
MPVYMWKGRTLAGEIQTGELSVDSQAEALAQLRKKRIIAQFVREKPKGVSLSLNLKQGGSVTTKDLAIFTRQFATMITAGLPLVQCLDILAQQSDSATLRKITTSRPAPPWPRRSASTRRCSTTCS